MCFFHNQGLTCIRLHSLDSLCYLSSAYRYYYRSLKMRTCQNKLMYLQKVVNNCYMLQQVDISSNSNSLRNFGSIIHIVNSIFFSLSLLFSKSVKILFYFYPLLGKSFSYSEMLVYTNS